VAIAHDRDRRICLRFRSLKSPLALRISHSESSPQTHETRLSIDVSMGFVLSDLRNDASPGVRAAEFDTIPVEEIRVL
jgi:hypothetical protein